MAQVQPPARARSLASALAAGLRTSTRNRVHLAATLGQDSSTPDGPRPAPPTIPAPRTIAPARVGGDPAVI